MLLYLEDLDAGAIGEITGLSAGAVATRIHRIKVLAGAPRQGPCDIQTPGGGPMEGKT